MKGRGFSLGLKSEVDLLLNKKSHSKLLRMGFLVRSKGFEPSHPKALPPEDSASTNFATCAFECKNEK